MLNLNSSMKRPRQPSLPPLDVQGVVAELHQAVTSQQRVNTLHNLLEQLEYNPTSGRCIANPEIFVSLVEAGAINVLCLQLGFALHRPGSTKDELELICVALALIYRSCPENVIQFSLSAIGSELFPLTIKALSWNVVQPVISILHSCSAGRVGTEMVLQCRALLSSLVDVMSNRKLDYHCLLEVLGLLKNLTYYGEDYLLLLIEQPGFLSQLTHFAFSDVCDKSLERLSAVLRNLATAPNTRHVLAQQSELLNALLRMASHCNRKVVRNVLNMLLSLAMEADSCVLLVLHGDGMILDILKRFIGDNTDEFVRKRAAQILRLMVCETSAPLLLHDYCLVETLSHRALSDTSSEVRTEATKAFAQLSGLVKAPMPQHDAILDALTHLASSPTVLPEILASAFKEQAGHPANRIPMAARKTLLEALARIATSSSASKAGKEDVCRVLSDLSFEEANRERIATDEILEALVANSVGNREDNCQKRLFAVKALLNLAAASSNRKKMVNHTFLLQSLIQYAASAPTDDLKVEVKKSIVNLVSEL